MRRVDFLFRLIDPVCEICERDKCSGYRRWWFQGSSIPKFDYSVPSEAYIPIHQLKGEAIGREQQIPCEKEQAMTSNSRD